VDGRTAERKTCPEVTRDSETTKLTPLVCRRGLWDEDEVTVHNRSDALDEERSPDLFDSPQRRDSAYYTAATERMGTRRTSGCLREQWSDTDTRETETNQRDEVNAKASKTQHSPNSHRKRSTQRKLLAFATSESDGEVSDVRAYEK